MQSEQTLHSVTGKTRRVLPKSSLGAPVPSAEHQTRPASHTGVYSNKNTATGPLGERRPHIRPGGRTVVQRRAWMEAADWPCPGFDLSAQACVRGRCGGPIRAHPTPTTAPSGGSLRDMAVSILGDCCLPLPATEPGLESFRSRQPAMAKFKPDDPILPKPAELTKDYRLVKTACRLFRRGFAPLLWSVQKQPILRVTKHV